MNDTQNRDELEIIRKIDELKNQLAKQKKRKKIAPYYDELFKILEEENNQEFLNLVKNNLQKLNKKGQKYLAQYHGWDLPQSKDKKADTEIS